MDTNKMKQTEKTQDEAELTEQELENIVAGTPKGPIQNRIISEE